MKRLAELVSIDLHTRWVADEAYAVYGGSCALLVASI